MAIPGLCSMLLLVPVLILCRAPTLTTKSQSLRIHDGMVPEWSQWSSCSSSCGEGVKIRFDKSCEDGGNGKCAEESKYCFDKFCPGYLGWPRIHFSGKIIADASTVNNIRCAYENEEFYPAQLSKRYIGVSESHDGHTKYTFATNNWNPDGTNQVYFTDTHVTSICPSLGRCVTDDPIVGSPMREHVRGIMSVLDVDWQRATEIWGLEVTIPGILKGTFAPSSHEEITSRVLSVEDRSRGYALGEMSRYISKLRNVTWYDDRYKSLFLGAEELSMTFAIDLFDQMSAMARVTGTIGMTSKTGALTSTSRIFQVNGATTSSAPFYYHENEGILTVDLTVSVAGFENGSISVGQLDLAAYLPECPRCRLSKWRRITMNGQISRGIGISNRWYTTYGGIIDIDLSHLNLSFRKLLTSTRLGIINKYGKVFLAEFPFGMNYGLLGRNIFRLDVGESETINVFASSFGKPVKNAQVNLYQIEGALADASCPSKSCNRSLGLPSSSLGISSNSKTILTNRTGVAAITITAVSDPGNPRGCGLDGQVYPLQVFIRYRRGKRTWKFSDNPADSGNVRQADYSTNAMSTAARIYKLVAQKQCPTWDDVQDIFLQYYNLYPVMWRYGIIDLHSYDDIRKHSKMLSATMFQTDISDARFMPLSRDLSKGKKVLIHDWIRCGMINDKTTTNYQKDSCTLSTLKNGIGEVQKLLEKAVMLELATIPIYMTAWFSLKTEYGMNKHIADILKSIFVEEMLHMTLAANVLNSVGGSVNLTDESKLPVYPNVLTSGYRIVPNVNVALAPFSIGMADQVFSEIEKPSDFKTKELIKHLGVAWEHLYGKDAGTIAKSMSRLLTEVLRKGNATEFDRFLLNTDLKAFSHKRDDWIFLREKVENIVHSIDEATKTSVGGMYSMIGLKLISLESCAKVLNSSTCLSNEKYDCPVGTIFQGDDSWQLNMSHWYQRSKDSILHVLETNANPMFKSTKVNLEDTAIKITKPPLFKVNDLQSALEAITEIIYQGEGGLDCLPLVPELDIYASLRGRDQGYEFSHYYRLREIVNGKKLEPSNGKNCKIESIMMSCSVKDQQHFCFTSEAIPFYENGVWPILFNPKKSDYRKGTKAYLLNEQFNLIYTRQLFCLENAFHGNPSSMQKCMSNMYDLTIAGKQLVRTPVQSPDTNKTALGRYGSPTWDFVRDKSYRAGFPIRS